MRSSRLPRGERLFSFAVLADTHVNEEEERSSSPYRTNALANARARYVMHEIAALDPAPAFVVHLGDVVHPVPSLPTYGRAVERYKAIAEAVRVPLHVVPGNHDIGDKSVDWMPADIVCDDYVKLYRQAFGADYFAFDHGPLRCVAINALLLNSGLADEPKQRAWLEGELTAHAGRRLFLFTHYPPYVFAPDERSTYDNIDEPARAWLLELVRRHRVEALFAGHVHNFWYDVYADAEIYLLPSTAFLRHDYSEFYRVAPGNEFGRGDAGKFGYCIVDVHEQGHVMRLVRSDGRALAPGAERVPRRTTPPAHAKTAPIDNVGVEMRHAWAEVMEIPSTGGVQEFGRKPARNDYPVMALWEMGVRLMKVPDHDVTQPYTRSRMELLRAVGHRFVATSLGIPRAVFTEALAAAPHLVDALEVNLSTQRLRREGERLRALRAACGKPLFWAKLRMHEDAHFDGAQFSHFVKSGLLPAELQSLPGLLEELSLRASLDGVVVRIDRDVDLLSTAKMLHEFQVHARLRVLGSVKLADASLAKTRDNDADTARLAAEAVLAGRAYPEIMLVFDTFMDIDRGYHPRNAFIDRMFNPRPASRAFAAMAHLLGHEPVVLNGEQWDGGARIVRFSTRLAAHALVSGCSRTEAARLARSLRATECVDLCAGEWGTLGEREHDGLWVLKGVRTLFSNSGAKRGQDPFFE